MLLERLRIAAKSREAAQHVASQAEPPIAGTLHLLLQQFVVRVVASLGEEAFAVTHLVATLHAETLAVGIGLQH